VTTWRIETTIDSVLRRVVVTLETNDPATLYRVEQAARRQGVELVRLHDEATTSALDDEPPAEAER
jgi:hypothetical protein